MPAHVLAGEPVIIAHRGASGYLPEHTLAAYALAIEMGADFIEPDLVMTGDGVLVCRHENEISQTTDVADHPKFAHRRTTRTIDGAELTGWFTEDFTLAELQTLRAKERIPAIRPANVRFDGTFAIPTFADVLALAASANRRGLSRPVGVYPETKHPSYFQGLGLAMEAPLIGLLGDYGFGGPTAPVFIQSFEVANLQQLHGLTTLPLIQLMEAGGAPFDFARAGDARTYADLATPAGLAVVARYAAGIGVNKQLIIPRTAAGRLGTPSRLVEDAHAAKLLVHAWTFRAENAFLPTEYRAGDDPAGTGVPAAEIAAFLALGVDGVFTDQPDVGVRTRSHFHSHS